MSTSNTKEIGGYLEMEAFRGEEFYPDLHRLNLARTAFVWILQHTEHKRVFLPGYICGTVIESAQNAGFDPVTYRIGEDLRPVWGAEGAPGSDDILYVVNYFGQLTAGDIEGYRDSYNRVIVDNAQAFYERPVEGVYTIYSLRKFFGVADGAYAAADIKASAEELPYDRTGDRVRYLAGRLEEGANEYYMDSKAAEDGFSNETPKRMSLFTQNMAKGIDYEAVRMKRRENYAALDGLLGSRNPFTSRVPECPYVYPYYHEKGIRLRKHLIANRVYIPTLWDTFLNDKYKGSLEYDWSANILCLPVDQRYDENDMQTIAGLIRSISWER